MVVVAGILLVAGFSASYQVSSARRAMERIESRNLRELAANSAFEEACARVQAALPRVAQLRAGETRDLGATASWPGLAPLTTVHRVEPEVTRADFALVGITLPDPVSIQSSSWQRSVQDKPDGTTEVQEIGIARLTTQVRVLCGGHESTFQVKALRYFVARPSATQADLELVIGPRNLGLEVIEKP